MSSLTDKQRAFINAYLRHWNGTKAAIEAGYSERSARQIASENLSKPDIFNEIERRRKELMMSTDEALLRLSNQGRASFAEMVKVAGGLPLLDWDKVIKSGAIDNVKEITFQKGKISVKLYDAQSALINIIRINQLNEGKATERVEYLTPEERTDRLAELLDAARNRRDGRADSFVQ